MMRFAAERSCFAGKIETVRVLIADDHSLLRDTLAMWLNQNDMETETAGDLPSAIALMESGPFDVVLLDFGMPGMDGLNGLARALASVGNARVALMSGVASRKVVGNALEMGAAGFLPKSLPAKSFVNAVRFIAMDGTGQPGRIRQGFRCHHKRPDLRNSSDDESRRRAFRQVSTHIHFAVDLSVHAQLSHCQHALQ